MPLPLKPAPEVVTWEMVTFALPVLATVTNCVPVLPKLTLPKLMLEGLAVSCTTGAAIPLPLSETSVGLLAALLTKEICPEALPVEAGANCAV